MNWIRRHSEKHRKEWYAGRGRYRVIWRDQAFGVSVPAAFQACVRVFVPNLELSIWDFIDRKKTRYRTLQVAKDACEKHANPDFKPVKKKRKRKGKAPTRVCPQCGAKLHVRKMLCGCGFKFPKKRKK